ncbi:hypothetical protein GCM10010423_26790 [Streptomyces levis]|uniref:Uncharacterized protein n=1 Tax=Streptomyces levis TaxID=285566 RepID=A0ABP6B0D5_9ACTN
MFTVGPGDISEYGTGMNTPAHRSAISIRVEASIVAVRRGMTRQYGTVLSAHRQGRPSGAALCTHTRVTCCFFGLQLPGRGFSIASRKRA